MFNGINDSSVSCRGSFKACRVLTLTSLFIYFSAIYAKVNFSSDRASSILTYNTRSKDNLFVPHYLKGSIRCQCVNFFNKLPSSITFINGTKKFKIKLKSYLIDHEFYSMNEFYT